MSIYDNNKKSINKVNECVNELNKWCDRIDKYRQELDELQASLSINKGVDKNG